LTLNPTHLINILPPLPFSRSALREFFTRTKIATRMEKAGLVNAEYIIE
jgi:hypothetical protein